MKSQMEKLAETVGCKLAQKLSLIATTWGNRSALRWAKDPNLFIYLAVELMNMPKRFFNGCNLT
jgi:hypothetical protein